MNFTSEQIQTMQDLQGVVTYTSPVEAFATGIKMESSDHFFFGANQGIKTNSEQLISTINTLS